MRYIPHTEQDIQEMLASIGAESIEDLFKSIPCHARLKNKLNLPAPLAESELVKHARGLGLKNQPAGEGISFLGAGSYQHHIPAAVKSLISRSEWMTPYTPYQPEISQGTLQAIFEYQTMICHLTSMDIANASHYDGATATAEAALMAINITKKANVVVSKTLHPEYRDTIKTILKPRGHGVIDVPFESNGLLSLTSLKEIINNESAAVIVQSPNFFGIIENLDEISNIVHSKGAMFIVAITEPISLGILKGPGEFGADIVTAEGQAFGGGLNYGGPYLGIFAAREKYLRYMPGRIVGETTDSDGRRGFVLTISTREQHIRREKATSNICSNEALLATTAAIYLALVGKDGLKKISLKNLSNAEYLKKELSKIDGVKIAFSAPTFNEFVIKTRRKPGEIINSMLPKGIFAGVALECWYPEMKEHILITTTECHNKEELDRFVSELKLCHSLSH